ncbi:MAG: FMN-binding negative transcriptional regulator [Bryobacteraceae bacterium]|jgi:transcriptional regulator
MDADAGPDRLMYTPAHFEVRDRDEIAAFMRRYNFAAIVMTLDGEITATHVPLVVRENAAELSLIGHFAKANPCSAVLENCEVLVIFTGPHDYVSPSLYDSKLSVPTWNYTAVHAYGTAGVIEAEPALMMLVEASEPAYREQWDALPVSFREKMIAGVTAFEIRVKKLEGKYKLSQNRPPADRARVAQAFEGSELGEFMKRVT